MNFLICNAIFLFERVSVGSFQHFLPVILAILFAVFFIKYAKSKLKENQQSRVIHRFACFVSLTVIVFHIHKLSFGHYNIATDLPLYLCNLLGIIIPVFTYYRKLWMYEVLLFWIIVGTLQGVISQKAFLVSILDCAFRTFNNYFLRHFCFKNAPKTEKRI